MPRSAIKSSTKDLSPPIFELVIQQSSAAMHAIVIVTAAVPAARFYDLGPEENTGLAQLRCHYGSPNDPDTTAAKQPVKAA